MRYTVCVDSVSVARSINCWDDQALPTPPAISPLRPCQQHLTLGKTNTPIDWQRKKARKLFCTWPLIKYSEAYFSD